MYELICDYSSVMMKDPQARERPAWNGNNHARTRRFYRDMGMRGWSGGSDGTKVMVFEVDMPHCEEETCTWNRPAVWALNAKVSDVDPPSDSCMYFAAGADAGPPDAPSTVQWRQ